ncbi:hypothetical protein [Mangrovibacterium diazotrophicum]|uniref:Uncharacterized protein n=1 Tax=Mangrovibacterium diazotrophicum TaxID=1261403 RepID=A0A419W9U1_9BACT|nr:hypothetical protein [Mangrovibacterium diazotrophicum]RKD92238.1 hypothetical protein BC643_2609 [Mangrovibacterium diazotrophicum]
MRIDRSNYESYFVDYIDGNLPADLVDEFLDFLENNPDLAAELKAVGDIKLEAETVIFASKEQLLKSESNINDSFDYRAVAFLEGDFSAEKKQQFESEVEDDSEKLKSLHLLKKMHLQADLSVQFPDKEKLLRKKRTPIYLWATRVAALLLLFFSVWALVPRKQVNNPQNQVAEQQIDQSQKSEKIELPKDVATENTVESQMAQTLPATEEKTEQQISPKKTVAIQPQLKTEPQSTGLVATRDQVPDKMQPLTAHLDMNSMAVSSIHMPSQTAFVPRESLSVDEFLAYKLIDAPKGESFTFNNLANAGLKAAQNISNDRLAVERNNKGKVEEIKFESRLIAFSIPFKKNR